MQSPEDRLLVDRRAVPNKVIWCLCTRIAARPCRPRSAPAGCPCRC